jgi:hypothetical protein
MKKAVLAGSKSGLSITLMKLPRVTRAGRHSSPEVWRPPRSTVLASESGQTSESIPTLRKAAANATAPP